MPQPTVGEIIRATRLLRGLSYRQLAAVADVGHTTIHRIEAGQPPSAQALWRLAKGLGLKKRDRLRLFKAAGQ